MRIKGLPARRTVLAGAAVLAAAGGAAGCSGDDDGSGGEGDDPTRTERLRRRSAAEARDLLRRYEATTAAHPGLAAALDPLRADVERHVAALSRGLPADARAGSPASPGAASPGAASPGAASPGAASPGDSADAAPPSPSSGSGPNGPSGPAVPADPAEAVAELAAAEKRTADAHTAALATAPGDLARLLASVAAAGAAHVYLLKETT